MIRLTESLFVAGLLSVESRKHAFGSNIRYKGINMELELQPQLYSSFYSINNAMNKTQREQDGNSLDGEPFRGCLFMVLHRRMLGDLPSKSGKLQGIRYSPSMEERMDFMFVRKQAFCVQSFSSSDPSIPNRRRWS